MSCLTEDRLIEMLDGRGLESALADERAHLAGCDACQDAWAMAASAAELLAEARPRRSRRASLLFPLLAAAGVLAVVIGLILAGSDGPPPSPRELVAVFLDGPEEDSRRARELLAVAGPAARHALLDARRRAPGSPRARLLHDLLHALRGQDAGLREKLEKRVDLSFDDVPLSDLLSYIAQFGGVDIVLDPGLAATVSEATIDLNLRSSPLREALDLACTVLDLDYDFRYGVLFMSTPKRLWRGERGETEGVLPLINRWAEEPQAGEDKLTAGRLRSIRITMDMQNAPLSAVVDYVREISGLSFALDPAAGGRAVSLRVNEVTLDHVVELITLPFGLDARLENGTLQLYAPEGRPR